MDQRVAAVDADGVFLGVNLVVMFQILIDTQEDLPRVFLCKSYGKDVEDIAAQTRTGQPVLADMFQCVPHYLNGKISLVMSIHIVDRFQIVNVKYHREKRCI